MSEPELTSEMPPPSRTSGKAITSLILGVLSFPFCLLSGVPGIIFGLLGLKDIGRSQGRVTGRGMAIAGIILSCLSLMMWVPGFFLGYSKLRETAKRIESRNNLRMIGLATLSHDTTHGKLPPAITSADGKPLLSWRVALLPELDEEALYRKFHLDEPWDSPHNKALIPEMPNVYVCPYNQLRSNHGEGLTYYRGFTGPGTFFGDLEGVPLEKVSANGNQTWLVVEARDPVPWTKPEELPYNPNGPVPQLGAPGASTFSAVLPNGNVENYPIKTDEQTQRQHISLGIPKR